MLKINLHIRLLMFTSLIFARGSFSTQKKNVVMIVADDLGWNDVSFHGSNQFLTPNIDALAYSGVILNNYYVLPVCTPSRSALMTGIHPIHTGMHRGVIHNNEPFGLPLDYKILPEYLKEYGYTTRAVGKWHLGFHKRVYTPLYRGFDSHFGYWGTKIDYFTHEQINSAMRGIDFKRNMKTCRNYTGQYATDLFTQESVDIINSHDISEPLFLYLAHLAPHTASHNNPLQAPAKVIKKFDYIQNTERRKLAAMIWKLDESVGRVVQALASRNMLKETIIIFTTDNGGAVDIMGGGGHASNWPLRGAKATNLEGGVRGIAFIWSADLPHSKICNALMHIQDWLPTIIAAVGHNGTINPTLLQGLDGRNMWPVLAGDKDYEYDELLIQTNTLRKNNWKIIKGRAGHPLWYGPSGRDASYSYNVMEIQQSPAARAISRNSLTIPTTETMIQVRANVTLSCDYCGKNEANCTPCVLSKEKACLFDLSRDPCEKNNLADKFPDITTTLSKMMKKYVPVRPVNKPMDKRANPRCWNRTWINWLDYVDTEADV